MNCRFCNTKAVNDFADLGFSPPSNSFLNEEQIGYIISNLKNIYKNYLFYYSI